MKLNAKIVFCLFIIAVIFSCNKDDNFSDTPELDVRDFYKLNSKIAIWKIGFTDGDGDIGVRNDGDFDNFIVSIYAVIDDSIIARPSSPYRIPVVDNIRTSRGIEGEFEFTIEIDQLKFDSLSYDSVFYQAYVLDRSNKQSNTVQTPIFRID